MNDNPQKWQHPGGKLQELGADPLTDADLLSHQAKSRSIGHTRRLIKGELKQELEQIDKIVRQILGSSEGSRYATSQGGEV